LKKPASLYTENKIENRSRYSRRGGEKINPYVHSRRGPVTGQLGKKNMGLDWYRPSEKARAKAKNKGEGEGGPISRRIEKVTAELHRN